jgi:hypothetical protein
MCGVDAIGKTSNPLVESTDMTDHKRRESRMRRREHRPGIL